MQAYGQTDTGCVRTRNQDYIYFSPEQTGDLENLFFLADGMGGYNGGEIASRLATETTKNYIQNNFDKIEHEKEAILKLIKDAIEYANFVVYEESKKDENLQGMGTTLDVCFIYNNKIYIGHVRRQ